MSTTEPPSTGRAAALEGLRAWGEQRAELDPVRRVLIAWAWNVNIRNISELAKEAGVSRDMIYGDLRFLGIDYVSKKDDPHLTRMINAFANLAQQFDARSCLSQPTRDAFGPVLAIAGAHMVTLQPRELITAINQVISVEPVGTADRDALWPLLHELNIAYAQYAVRFAPVSVSPRPGSAA